MNKLIISGHLTKDAEFRTSTTGKPMLYFTVAVNEGYGDNKEVLYFSCGLFGARATEKLAGVLTKGVLVNVDGRVNLNIYQKKDGTSAANLKVLVNDVEIVFNKSNEQNSQSSNYQKKPIHSYDKRNLDKDDLDPDIPF